MTCARQWIPVFVAATLLTACGGESAPKAPQSTDQLMQRWAEAGLNAASFRKIDGAKLKGGECVAGTVNRIATTICHYETKAAAASAQPAGLRLVGSRTGAALVQGKLLLVVADRAKADASGRSINRMTKIFRGRKVTRAVKAAR